MGAIKYIGTYALGGGLLWAAMVLFLPSAQAQLQDDGGGFAIERSVKGYGRYRGWLACRLRDGSIGFLNRRKRPALFQPVTLPHALTLLRKEAKKVRKLLRSPGVAASRKRVLRKSLAVLPRKKRSIHTFADRCDVYTVPTPTPTTIGTETPAPTPPAPTIAPAPGLPSPGRVSLEPPPINPHEYVPGFAISQEPDLRGCDYNRNCITYNFDELGPDLQGTKDDQDLNATISYLGHGKWRLEVENKTATAMRIWFPYESQERPLGSNPDDDFTLLPWWAGVTELARTVAPDSWQGLDYGYPGPLFAPFTILADWDRARVVAAVNWPPRRVFPIYSRHRLAIGYDDLLAAGTEQSYEVIAAMVSTVDRRSPWHLAVDTYRAWLNPQLEAANLVPRYSDSMQQSHGWLGVILSNYPDHTWYEQLQSLWDSARSKFNWIQLWGQMSAYGGSSGELWRQIHPRYEELPSFLESVAASQARVSLYARPRRLSGSYGLLTDPALHGGETNFEWFNSWFQLHRLWGANASYLDVLGLVYLGDTLFMSERLRDTWSDSVIEGPSDTYPAAFLLSGSLAYKDHFLGYPEPALKVDAAQREREPENLGQDFLMKGLEVSYYEEGSVQFSGELPPLFEGADPLTTTTDVHTNPPWFGSQVRWRTSAGQPLDGIVSNFAVRFTGELDVKTAGDYVLKLGSKDGSRLYLDGVMVIDNDGLHEFREQAAEIAFDAPGLHQLAVEYFHGDREGKLSLKWQTAGLAAPVVIPAGNFQSLTARYYSGFPLPLTSLPDFNSPFMPLFLAYETQESMISFGAYGENVAWRSAGGEEIGGLVENFVVRYRGKVRVPEAGLHSFILYSNFDAWVLVDGSLTVARTGVTEFNFSYARLSLAAGFHDIEIIAHKRQETETKLQVRWQLPGGANRVLNEHDIFHVTTSTAITFMPFVHYLLHDRIFLMGASNADHFLWGHGYDRNHYTERTAFRLGDKFDIRTILDTGIAGYPDQPPDTSAQNPALALAISERERVGWYERTPKFLDKIGLTAVPAGVTVYRFEDRDGRTLLTVDNWSQQERLTFLLDGKMFDVPTQRLSIVEVD